jgi:hypothetical protein
MARGGRKQKSVPQKNSTGGNVKEAVGLGAGSNGSKRPRTKAPKANSRGPWRESPVCHPSIFIDRCFGKAQARPGARPGTQAHDRANRQRRPGDRHGCAGLHEVSGKSGAGLRPALQSQKPARSPLRRGSALQSEAGLRPAQTGFQPTLRVRQGSGLPSDRLPAYPQREAGLRPACRLVAPLWSQAREAGVLFRC